MTLFYSKISISYLTLLYSLELKTRSSDPTLLSELPTAYIIYGNAVREPST